MSRVQSRQDPIVVVVDFHHARGPEIELCFGEDGTDPSTENDWSLLPFMALSDGAHASTEEFSYFTLRREATSPTQPATSLFGISCSRQIDSNILTYRPPDVTRSTVQKSVVVVTDSPQSVGQLREKLSVVTSAWFAQRNFSDFDILKKFRENLVISLNSEEARKDQNLGLSLREMIHEFKYQTLVLFKALLLQPKRLCMIQFSLISLIPGLINNLEDCADPAFDSYIQNVVKPTTLKTSDRSSCLPLQIFGKGSMFGPYTPLQQLDLLADYGTKSYVVGSTNSLLLQQKDRYSDILINLDEDTINIPSPALRNALSLSAADRRWIDFITQIVNETWDDAHPQHPKTHAYMGSEEFIRLQFEEYLLALLSCMKYHEDLDSFNTGESGHKSRAQLEAFNIEGDPALEFNSEFLTQWQTTPNYALFKRLTSDALLFSIVEPRHPCAGGLTIEDVQRRFSQQVAELHLDERVREGREALNRHLSTGQKKVSAAFNSFWADIDNMRDAQRKKNEEKATQSQTQSRRSSMERPSMSSPPLQPSDSASITSSTGSASWLGGGNRKAPPLDVAQAQASVSGVGQKAGAYLSSWGTWASEKRKEWQDKKATSPSSPSSASITSPSTPTLRSISEVNEANAAAAADRGRCHSMPRYSEESSTGAGAGADGSLSRSGSRRKRWSNILLRRDSGEFSLQKKDDGNNDSSEVETPYPRSPLSREAPILGNDLRDLHDHGVEQQEQQSTTERPVTRATTTTTTSSEAEADRGITITELLAAENVEENGSENETRSFTTVPLDGPSSHHEAPPKRRPVGKSPTTPDPAPLQSVPPNADSVDHQADGEVDKMTTTT